MTSWGPVNWQIQLFASIAVSIFFLISYYRFPSIKKFTSLLAISSLVFILNFIFLSDLGYLFDENKQKSSLQESYPPIIMVVLDGLPLASLLNENLEFDSTHFPNFTALAAKSNWYRFLQGTYTNTTQAIPVILTGNLEVKKAPTHKLYPNNILNHLGDYYRIYSEEPATSLANARTKQSKSSWNIFLNDVKIVYLHLFLPPQLALSLPQIDDNWSHFDVVNQKNDFSNQGGRLFIKFIRNINKVTDNNFYFLHTVFPHSPFEITPSLKMFPPQYP
jgi:hypothetical protein